uniref:Uncharacterized protein n=1 Tax=Pipistrellus kuhlii TaxID=59472 RepID=A0A7J8B240_PIPKU|nr:hypothetical protein mPipKuh1_007910 [Pipistrellus kuhlii]
MYKAVGLFSYKVGERVPLGVNSKNVSMSKAPTIDPDPALDLQMTPYTIISSLINDGFSRVMMIQQVTADASCSLVQKKTQGNIQGLQNHKRTQCRGLRTREEVLQEPPFKKIKLAQLDHEGLKTIYGMSNEDVDSVVNAGEKTKELIMSNLLQLPKSSRGLHQEWSIFHRETRLHHEETMKVIR